ncbi:MAG: hypothetical protein WDN49_16515 [Acetobacteraceae bacterium]
MLAPAQRDHRAEAHQPEKQDAGQFLDPDDWAVEQVAPDHAGKQDGDLDDDERRRNALRQPVDQPVQRPQDGGRSPGGAQERGPVVFSSAAHSAGPNLVSHVL